LLSILQEPRKKEEKQENRCPFKKPVCQISRMCLGHYFQWLWMCFCDHLVL